MTYRHLAWAPGARHLQIPHAYATGSDAVIAQVRLCLETQRGTYPDDDLWGVPYTDWMTRPSVTDAEITITIRSMLVQIPGVLSVDSITVTRRPVLTIATALTVQGEGAPTTATILTGPAPTPDPRLLSIVAASGVQTTPLRVPEPVLRPNPIRQAPPAVLALDAFAWWDPLLHPGTYTSPGTYTALADQSGNGRNMAADSAPNTYTSTTAFPVRGGTQVLPAPCYIGGLWWADAGTIIGTEFSMVAWGHHAEPHDNAQSLGAFLNTGFSRTTACMVVRWNSPGQLAIVPDGVTAVDASMPQVPSFPQRATGGSVDGWWVWGITYKAGSWRWHVIGDMDDGLGIREFALSIPGNTWFSTALASSIVTAQGVSLSADGGGPPGKEAGGAAVWVTELTEQNLKLSMVYAAGLFSEAAETGARTVLGV